MLSTERMEVVIYREGYETPWFTYHESCNPLVEEYMHGAFWVWFDDSEGNRIFHIWPKHYTYKINNTKENES